MALNNLTATRIVLAVTVSSESRKRIDSPLAKVLPNRLGVSGSVRNIGMIFLGYDGSEPTASKLSCVGISDSTSTDITAAKIEGVKSALPHDRPNARVAHTATLVAMADGSEYVFDWHSTLQSIDPTIFRKTDWEKGVGGVLYSSFKGFE